MAQISLKKIASKKEVLALIECLVNAIDTAISIEDINGNKLLGTEVSCFANRYPVELLDEVIGWVIGEEKVKAVASLMSYLAKQEFEKKALANELLDKYREITLIHNISTQITASLDLQEVAQLVIEEAKKLIQSTNGSILLLNQANLELETLSTFGQTSGNKIPLKLGQGIIGSIIQSGRGEIINDVSSDPRLVNTKQAIASLICVPLKTKDQVVGAITLSSQTSVTYTAGDLKRLTMLALQAAVAIEKALLYEQSRNATKAAQAQTQQLQQALHELQQTQVQLIQSEKMSSLGQLIAGVAHEINNPINFIGGNLRHAQQYSQDLLQLLQLYNQHPCPTVEIQNFAQEIDLEFLREDLPQLLGSMQMGVDRIHQIIQSLRNFSRQDSSKISSVNLHEGIEGTLLILHNRIKATGTHGEIKVIKEYGDLPPVDCYVGQLNQVFMNLISNAIDALENQPEPRTITIRTEVIREECLLSSPANSVVIRIADNGSGMSEAVKSHLFESFFTTKPVGKGTGLGLSISQLIITEKHGGVLKCISEPGQGTEFWIQIPVSPFAISCCDRFEHLLSTNCQVEQLASSHC